jgi:hypothetical protein
MSRKTKILDYLNEWHGGYWDLRTKDEGSVPERVAENVLSYHEIAETRENVREYAEDFEELLEAGTVHYLNRGSGLELEVA